MISTLSPHVLLVEDDDAIRKTTALILEEAGFHVVEVSGVQAALELLPLQRFDALLTDLHMPFDGDGLTVVSAMRHFNPEAVTLILSGYPEMDRAAAAILAQADGILVKPCGARNIIDSLWDRLKKGRVDLPIPATVATILDEGTQATISDWLVRVAENSHFLTVKMADKDRSLHLPQLFRDLVAGDSCLFEEWQMLWAHELEMFISQINLVCNRYGQVNGNERNESSQVSAEQRQAYDVNDDHCQQAIDVHSWSRGATRCFTSRLTQMER